MGTVVNQAGAQVQQEQMQAHADANAAPPVALPGF